MSSLIVKNPFRAHTRSSIHKYRSSPLYDEMMLMVKGDYIEYEYFMNDKDTDSLVRSILRRDGYVDGKVFNIILHKVSTRRVATVKRIL